MSSQVNVSVKVNESEVYAVLQSDGVQTGMDELADAALEMQRVLCPVDTTKLVTSLEVRKNGNGRDIGSFTVDYAAAVENGHETEAGTWVPAQPFIRPSLDAVRARLASG